MAQDRAARGPQSPSGPLSAAAEDSLAPSTQDPSEPGEPPAPPRRWGPRDASACRQAALRWGPAAEAPAPVLYAGDDS